MIRVALADDHPLILKILRQELGRELDVQILWDTSDLNQLLPRLRRETPDVLVLDLAFAGQNFEPVSAVRDLRAQFPQLMILILSAYDEPAWVEELIHAGVKGYVVKSDDFSLRLAEGIRAVAQQRTFLSPTAVKALTASRQKYTLTERERAILRLAAQGQSNPDIATTLGLAQGTVRNHLSNIYAKLEVDTREAAIRAAQNLRELPRPGANARHELRTPLHTLLGMARLLQSRLERTGTLGPDDAEFVQQIILEAERLDRLIEAAILP
ncbi:MAG TPA: LuxR C-terminal-related transcriptional regulator [Phototrophicaceae bacterium]|nr:LuxR C-terminal-related transcriptional regulator [Phototrophicaceae bacterium]